MREVSAAQWRAPFPLLGYSMTHYLLWQRLPPSRLGSLRCTENQAESVLPVEAARAKRLQTIAYVRTGAAKLGTRRDEPFWRFPNRRRIRLSSILMTDDFLNAHRAEWVSVKSRPVPWPSACGRAPPKRQNLVGFVPDQVIEASGVQLGHRTPALQTIRAG
jgi:hypothetical protein